MRRERASVFLRLFQTSVSTSISETLDVLASTAKEDSSNAIQPVLTHSDLLPPNQISFSPSQANPVQFPRTEALSFVQLSTINSVNILNLLQKRKDFHHNISASRRRNGPPPPGKVLTANPGSSAVMRRLPRSQVNSLKPTEASHKAYRKGSDNLNWTFLITPEFLFILMLFSPDFSPLFFLRVLTVLKKKREKRNNSNNITKFTECRSKI